MSFNHTMRNSFVVNNTATTNTNKHANNNNDYTNKYSKSHQKSTTAKTQKSHKIEPKILIPESNTTLQMLTMPSPSNYNDKENLMIVLDGETHSSYHHS